MTLKHFILSLTFPVLASAEVVDIKYESLKNLLEQRQTKLEAHRLEADAMKLRKDGHLGRSFLPSFELYAGQESFKKGLGTQKSQPGYGVEANLNLYNGGKDRLSADIYDLGWQKKNLQYRRISADELLLVRKLYWEILYAKEKIALLEGQTKLNEQNSASALKRIRSGVATESDKMEFEIKAVDLKQDLEMSKLQLKIQTDELKVLLNVNEKSEVKLPDTIGHQHTFEESVKHSHEDHELISKESDVQASINEFTSQKEANLWRPKLDVVAGFHQFNQREEPEFSTDEERRESFVGLRLSLSIPEGLNSLKESQALAQEATAYRRLADFQRKQAHAHVESEIAELKLLHSQIHDAEENIQRAEKYYQLTLSEYARGVKNSPDMLSASEKIFEVKNRRLQILKDFNLKQAHVLAKIEK
ncbi:MAG: TolC family protein [Bdellovibrionaceae bacterium]|nr:TolC family protein [Pseudobdellovibrionaceae bacterium]